jgi:hypothetical protein
MGFRGEAYPLFGNGEYFKGLQNLKDHYSKVNEDGLIYEMIKICSSGDFEMKTLMLTIMILWSPFFAEAAITIECSTSGDALGVVQIIESRGENVIKVTYSNDESETWKLENINSKKTESKILIGSKKPGAIFGGAFSDSVLLVLDEGNRSAHLAANGKVYILNCAPIRK